ncbi:AraC family transcriptional regulator [Leeia oryzae]|uniref:AraC family transcriptional regulator n=1 Tax=Leeia oryzae TaxID=356662 RepID=UPI000527C929|nr:AraC family transcriptional regulator [Leeia oryzae]
MTNRLRNRSPELEHYRLREPTHGFEPKETYGFLRYLQHGFPNPLVRWHYHEEYELHLIVDTKGKVFVGDYIGQFEPGHLVLTGPRLPHNWISVDVADEGVALRDMALQFAHEPLESAIQLIPEMREILPLLERARHGIEFFGMSEAAEDYFIQIRETSGLERFICFLRFMRELALCQNYRLLSTSQLQSFDDDASLAQVSTIVNYITEHCETQFSMTELADRVGMSESKFSRFFKRATGNSFTDFVNRLRINKACQLLMETDRYITNVCYDVGFNNVANFNRRFLALKGMTPKEFRRQAEDRFGRL